MVDKFPQLMIFWIGYAISSSSSKPIFLIVCSQLCLFLLFLGWHVFRSTVAGLAWLGGVYWMVSFCFYLVCDWTNRRLVGWTGDGGGGGFLSICFTGGGDTPCVFSGFPYPLQPFYFEYLSIYLPTCLLPFIAIRFTLHYLSPLTILILVSNTYRTYALNNAHLLFHCLEIPGTCLSCLSCTCTCLPTHLIYLPT